MIARLRRTLQRFNAQPPVRRELLLLAAALLFSLIILPPLIWLAGKIFLGDYLRDPSGTPTGGPVALMVDFVAGVLRLSPGHWIALLGPYLLTVAWRTGRRVLKM